MSQFDELFEQLSAVELMQHVFFTAVVANSSEGFAMALKETLQKTVNQTEHPLSQVAVDLFNSYAKNIELILQKARRLPRTEPNHRLDES